jgi:hypothetical protein
VPTSGWTGWIENPTGTFTTSTIDGVIIVKGILTQSGTCYPARLENAMNLRISINFPFSHSGKLNGIILSLIDFVGTNLALNFRYSMYGTNNGVSINFANDIASQNKYYNTISSEFGAPITFANTFSGSIPIITSWQQVIKLKY